MCLHNLEDILQDVEKGEDENQPVDLSQATGGVVLEGAEEHSEERKQSIPQAHTLEVWVEAMKKTMLALPQDRQGKAEGLLKRAEIYLAAHRPSKGPQE